MADGTSPQVTIINPSVGAVPQNGVKPSTPQLPAEPKPVAPVPDAAAEREAQLKAREDVITKRERDFASEAKKAAQGKNGLGAKLSKLSEYEKREQLAKLNPPEYLKGIYGDGWYDTVMSTHANGVPTANLLAAELQKVREEFRQTLEQREEASRAAAKSAEQSEYEAARADTVANCRGFYESKTAEYPIFKKLGDAQRIGEMLTARIEAHARATGKLLSTQEAADGLESDMWGLVEEAASHDKYRGRLQEKLKPATVSPSSGASGAPQSSTRRTLSNHLTATTTGRTPPRSDAERQERAIQAFNAARAKSAG